MNLNEECLLNYLKNGEQIINLSLMIENFLCDKTNNGKILFDLSLKEYGELC